MIPEGIHWHRTAPPAPACETLAGDKTADVAIIGAGLTGLRTAITLAEAGVDTAVLDAQSIGFGSSGRSGGQCNPIWRATPDDLRKKFGAEQSERLIRTTLTAADDLFDDIRRYKVDCDAEQNGWIQAANTRSAERGLKQLHAAWAEVGADITVLSTAQTHEAVGSDAYDFALRHGKGGFVQPMALTRGYAKAAKANGARLYEQAPAQQVERQGQKISCWVSEEPLRLLASFFEGCESWAESGRPERVSAGRPTEKGSTP